MLPTSPQKPWQSWDYLNAKISIRELAPLLVLKNFLTIALFAASRNRYKLSEHNEIFTSNSFMDEIHLQLMIYTLQMI